MYLIIFRIASDSTTSYQYFTSFTSMFDQLKKYELAQYYEYRGFKVEHFSGVPDKWES